MNKFELFTMIYYVLDSAWEDNKDKELGNFLSSMNPFLFEEIGSAVPDVYNDFLKIVEKAICIESSYSEAEKYVAYLNNPHISKAFSSIDSDEWTECCKEYLSSPHKGQTKS